jgi:hypothetical protein
LLAAGCKKEEKAPFTNGSRFSYATSYTTTEERITKYDTLSFTIEGPDITNPDRKEIRWENTRHDYYQIRGLNTEGDIIELQLPVNYGGYANEQVAIAGHLIVAITAQPGDTLNKENKYQNGYGKLNGLSITQHVTYLRDTSIFFDGEELVCRLLESHNISQTKTLGKYSIVYTYNPEYGFITMDFFYPNKKRISLQLADIAINGK